MSFIVLVRSCLKLTFVQYFKVAAVTCQEILSGEKVSVTKAKKVFKVRLHINFDIGL